MKDFDKADFSVEKYTKQLVKECVGGADLQQRKNEIQEYSEQTSATLKKSVYANYMQFIETAKEISHLESEMYQLSHILIEQRNILSSLTEGQLNPKSGNAEDENSHVSIEDAEKNHATRAVQEIVQGYKGNLEGKTFLNEGALIELDPNDYRPIQRVFFFLFNDILIVCKVKHDKRLEFLTEYDPKKIAVINIKDLDGVRNAINIITPNGSKIFQSVTAAGKTEWIEKIEIAFRFDQQKKTSKKGPAPQPPKTLPSKVDSQTNKYKKLDIPHNIVDQSSAQNHEEFEPDWISTACEETQTLIAQRHFEDAQALIQRTNEYLAKNNNFLNADKINEKVKLLEQHMSNVLLQELSNCHCRNLQVALRASSHCLKILVDMGRARQAQGTLLKVCSNALRTSQREARRNNAKISELFFCDLTQVACEFLRAFQKQPACVSGLIVWCNSELQYFAGQLIKHYLTKGTPLDAVAKCMESIRLPCAKLADIGLDLSYHLEGLLHNSLQQLIEDSRIRLLQSIGRTDDTWQPYNLQTKTNLKRMLLEFDGLGIDIRPYTTGDTWINLTQTTVGFTRHYLQITKYCGSLARSEALAPSLEVLLRDIIIAQHVARPPQGFAGYDPNFVSKNQRFLLESLLPIAIEIYTKISGRRCYLLQKVKDHLQKQAPMPKQRSVYQTDVL